MNSQSIEVTPRILDNERLYKSFLAYIERVFEKKIDQVIQKGLTLNIKFKEA